MGAGRIDREAIVGEAIALMNESGLEAVSLRRIGVRLGVQAPSLYHHIASKEELFRLMARHIFADCLARVPDCPDWETWLTAFADSIWRAQHETRDALDLILAMRNLPRGDDTPHRHILDTLERLGLPRAIGQVAHASVQSLVTGWTMIGRAAAASDDPAFAASLRALIRGWRAELAECGGNAE